MIRSNKLVGILSSIIVSFSVLVLSITNGQPVFAAETGGYPWADASEVSLVAYEWGYASCPADLSVVNVCKIHVGYRNGKPYFESDPWRYDLRNCTSFVAWKVHDKYNLNINNWGNANQWALKAMKAGYVVDSKPRENDIAVWTGGLYGHVAYVTGVNGDGSVNVEQYNKTGKGEFSRQSRVRANSYIHVAPVEVSQAPKISETFINSKPAAISSAVNSQQIPQKAEAIELTKPKDVKDEKPAQVKDDSTQYFAGSVPSEQKVKTFEIHRDKTSSGKVEIKVEDEPNIVTPEQNISVEKSQYTLEDMNADGKLDMYVFYYSGTASNKVEVSVLDGASNFNSYMGKWTLNEPAHGSFDASYLLGDYDGDNKLDIFQFWQDHTTNSKLSIKVFNGADGFQSLLNDTQTSEPNQSLKDTYFNLADNNDDGKLDIFAIHHNNTVSKKVEITIFDGNLDWKANIAKWQSDDQLYSGVGPSLL